MVIKSSKEKNAPLQMADIARLAGVSKSTVSRALADSSLVSQKTKDLVIRIAKEHNYRPNLAARNFRLKESLTISVILVGEQNADWRISDPFFLELLGCIAEAIDNHGHQLLVSKTTPQTVSWVSDFVKNRQADGVILIGQGRHYDELDQLAKSYRGISVWGTQIYDDHTYPVVGTNNILGGYRATKHLLDQGKKQPIFLGYADDPEIKHRYQGFCNALKEAGINSYEDKSTSRVNSGNLDFLQTEFQRIIDSGVKFDAVFAVSDLLAISAIHSLESLGIQAPKDVSVVGYDDIDVASYCNPPLTTIRQNRSLGAKILVDNLLEALDGNEPEKITLDPQLIVRKSS